VDTGVTGGDDVAAAGPVATGAGTGRCARRTGERGVATWAAGATGAGTGAADLAAGRARAGRVVSRSLPGPRDLAAFSVRAFSARACAGFRCHTRADSAMWSFSANGAIRHQVRGSEMYRRCELTSSGSRLFSMTGRVVSQVSSPGGST
jgi:hypothetical protein